MKSYLALISIDLKLALRQRMVIFFNYLFPLGFFITFAQVMHGERGSGMTFVLTMVMIIGTLSNGLFGAGVRAVQERENNVLRRYKVTPITPAPLLIAATVVGWILFMPFVILMFGLAHYVYGMPWPASLFSIFVFATLGITAFRSIGMILASVANSMSESQIVVQLIYLPMLLLSGATIPSSVFPEWLLIVTQFLPATYLVSGLQGMMLRNENLAANGLASLALGVTIVIGLFISYKLFRWEKDEKIRGSAKLWIVAVLLPFFVLGGWQAHTKQAVVKTRILARQLARNENTLIRGARIFVGDGQVIETGAILIREGKIAEIYQGAGPEPESVKATPIEAAGKTVLPGLIDVHIHLGAPGGFYPEGHDYSDQKTGMERRLAAYLYSGVTTVRSVGDLLDAVLAVRSEVNSGAYLGAELQTCGPLFTARGGHGTEYFKELPENIRKQLELQFLRIPQTEDEARKQVDELKGQGVDCIKEVLESGGGSSVFNRMDVGLFDAVAKEAHQDGLPLAVHTGDARDVADALAAKADSIEHGSMRDRIGDDLLRQMAAQKTFYDPTLSVAEAFRELAAGRVDLLKRTLVQQVGPADMLTATEKQLQSPETLAMRQRIGQFPLDLTLAEENLKRAFADGVPLVTGSDAGNLLVVHGPTIQREVELWVQAGIPPAAALQAATYNAARLMRAEQHIGTVRVGNDADLLVVDGNPLEDISTIERVSLVFFKGENVDRSALFDQNK